MDRKKPKNNKMTRYTDSVVYFKSLSCKASYYEDRVITDYCIRHKLSKSLLLTSAAMYCIKHDIDIHEILDSTLTPENFNLREYLDYIEKDDEDE